MRLTPLALAAVAAAAALPAVASAAPANFRTPSGNIGCYVDAASARCDIIEHDYTAPRRPPSCRNDWGDAVAVDRGAARGRWVCHGDTAFPPPGARYRVRYGTTVRRGGSVCRVTTAGVTCRNARGAGFFLSRQRVRLIRA